MIARWLAVVLLAGPAMVHAQGTTPGGAPSNANPIASSLEPQYETARDYLLKAAHEMPAADYGYRPSVKVRTFGQLVGHVAGGEYTFCSAARGETAPTHRTDDSLTTKADYLKMLTLAFGYCDSVYASAQDAHMMDSVSVFHQMRTRLYVLVANIGHLNEHYGNVVVYLRARGLVPPSSQPAK